MSYTDKTSVPQLILGTNGISLPNEGEVLNGVINDFLNAFGNKLKFYNQNGEFLLSTPQGQLVSSIAAIISDRNRLLAYYVNQVDPSYAVGRMQDAIGRIYFIERKVATKTSVIGKCSGVSGTEIPAGTKVKDQSGNVYQSLQEAVIGQDGYVNILFICTEEGPISCLKGSLTERYQVIQGWESITNEADGEVGVKEESQAQFEQRRRQSVAKNSLNSVDSIMAALLGLDEVEDAYVTENFEGEEKRLTDQVILKPHSIYVCVFKKATMNDDDFNGKSDFAKKVAKEIWRKKAPGCSLNGQVEAYVEDDTKDIEGKLLYEENSPTYAINFDYAQGTDVYITITMSEPKPIVGDPRVVVIDAIYNLFTGQDGSKKPRIGSQILASQFYCAIQSLGDWIRIINLKIGLAPDPKEDMIQVKINQMPVLSKQNIKVIFQ